jgi:hypothetical protein
MLTWALTRADFVSRQNTTPIYIVGFRVNASIHDEQLKHFREGQGRGTWSSSFCSFLGYEDKKAAIKDNLVPRALSATLPTTNKSTSLNVDIHSLLPERQPGKCIATYTSV